MYRIVCLCLYVVIQPAIGCRPRRIQLNKWFNKTLDIVSLNLWGDSPNNEPSDPRTGFVPPFKIERVKGLTETINKYGFDVVFLQGVWFSEDHDRLARSLPYSTGFGAGTKCSATDKNVEIVFPSHCHGLMTLSKFDLGTSKFITFKERDEIYSNNPNNVEIERGFLATKLKLENGMSVLLINTNIVSFDTPKDRQRATELMTYVDKDVSNTVILAGSFNSDAKKNEIVTFLKSRRFKDSFESVYIQGKTSERNCTADQTCSTVGNTFNTFTNKDSPQYREDNILILTKTTETQTQVLSYKVPAYFIAVRYKVPAYFTAVPNDTKLSLSNHDPVHIQVKTQLIPPKKSRWFFG